MSRVFWFLSVSVLVACGCDKKEDGGSGAETKNRIMLRVGHFPNVTHAQGLLGHHLSRQAAVDASVKGWFEERLGPGVEVQWFAYNAGPSAMEAIFAGSLDLTYVGPSPALNAYTKSRGEEIRVIAGSALGGAALVVPADGRIKAPADFRGKKVATPQMGNTQDISCRAWLIQQGFKVTQEGGDVLVLPVANPDQLSLFKQGDIDAVWTVEPWIARLELEAAGKVFLEEKDVMTTILVSSVKFLKDHNDLARKFAQAHAELTDWIQKNPQKAQETINKELKEETSREMPAEIIQRAWSRLRFTSEVDMPTFEKYVKAAQSVGFLKEIADLSRLVEKL